MQLSTITSISAACRHVPKAVVLNLFKGAEPQDRPMSTHRTPQGVVHKGRPKKTRFPTPLPCPQVSVSDETHLPFPCGCPHFTLYTALWSGSVIWLVPLIFQIPHLTCTQGFR